MKQALQTIVWTAAFGALVAEILMAAGCASAPLRTDRQVAEIRAAQQAGAESVPRAAYHLQLAQAELENSRKIAEGGDKEKAQSMLMRAEADAELAVALAREDSEEKAGQDTVNKVRQMQSTDETNE